MGKKLNGLFVATVILVLLAGCSKKPVSKQECDLLYQCVSIELVVSNKQAEHSSGQKSEILAENIKMMLGIKTKRQEILDLVYSELRTLDRIIHPHRTGGLSRVNSRLQAGEWMSINPSLYLLTSKAAEYYKSSNGYYNAALGNLIALWGFELDPKSTAGKKRPEVGKILEILRQDPAMDQLEFDGIRVRSSNPSVSLQFGLLYQGYMIQLVKSMLAGAGINQAVITTNNAVSAYGTEAQYNDTNHNRLYPIRKNETLCHANIRDHFFMQDQLPYHTYLDVDTGYPAATIDHVVVIDESDMNALAACQALMTSDGREWEITIAMMEINAAELNWRNNRSAQSSAMEERRK